MYASRGVAAHAGAFKALTSARTCFDRGPPPTRATMASPTFRGACANARVSQTRLARCANSHAHNEPTASAPPLAFSAAAAAVKLAGAAKCGFVAL